MRHGQALGLALVALLAVLRGVRGDTFSCFHCGMEAECLDPFLPSKTMLVNCSSEDTACAKIIGKCYGIKVVKRHCTKNTEEELMDEMGEFNKDCVGRWAGLCRLPTCNGASERRPRLAAPLLLALLAPLLL